MVLLNGPEPGGHCRPGLSRFPEVMKKDHPNKPDSNKACQQTKPPSRLKEGRDYYINDRGLLVLKARYLLEGGIAATMGAVIAHMGELKKQGMPQIVMCQIF